MTSVQTHEITKGDTLTPLGAILKQKGDAGTLEVVDLTTYTVKFRMVDESGNDVVPLTVSNVTVVNATAGKVQYDFQAADVDTAGTFYAWFFVTSGSDQDAYPVGKKLKIIINDFD